VTDQPLMPNPSVDQHLLSNLRRARLEMEELDPQFDEVLTKFDEEIRKQKSKRTQKSFIDALSKLQGGYLRLQVNQRLYVNAIVLLIVFLSSAVILGTSELRGVLFLSFAFWAAAICYDLLALYKKVYENLLGKAALLLLFSLCTNFAVVLSAQVVNNIVGVDPSKFPHTIALLAILYIPFLAAIGFYILFNVFYLILALVSPLLLVFHIVIPDGKAKTILLPGYAPPKEIPFRRITIFVQFVSIAIFCYVMFGLSTNVNVMQSYTQFLSNTASSFLYHWEMYSKTQCNVEPGTRVTFVSDDRILVGTKDLSGISFKLRECTSLNQ
jgi:hypothetical protein